MVAAIADTVIGPKPGMLIAGAPFRLATIRDVEHVDRHLEQLASHM
jgi:hypothetical protein